MPIFPLSMSWAYGVGIEALLRSDPVSENIPKADAILRSMMGHTTGTTNNDDDADQKMIVYQALVDYLEQRRITPRLINVEFVDSPYFRMEQ